MYDNIPFALNRQQFHLRNGGDGACVRVGDKWLYKNGAHCEIHPLGAQTDPHENDYIRLSVIWHYHKANYEAAVVSFNRLERDLQQRRFFAEHSNGMVPPNSEVEKLELRQRMVKRLERKMDAAKEAVLAVAHKRPGNVRKTFNEELPREQTAGAARQRRVAAFGAKLDAIKI